MTVNNSSWFLLLISYLFPNIKVNKSWFHFLIQTLPELLPTKSNAETPVKTQTLPKNSCSNENFSTDELKTVMDRLGMPFEQNADIEEIDFPSLFDEEPCLEEVKEAFDVFDENKDGFIDSNELQRVFWCLGTKEGFGLEKCKKMIDIFDENGDGVIDCHEFAKVLEKCFS